MELQIEESVIGSLLIKPEFIKEVNEIISEKDFKVDLYRHAYQTIKSMSEKNMAVELNGLYLEMGRPGNASILAKSMNEIIFDPVYYATQLRKRNLEDEIKRTAGEREFEITKYRIKEIEMLGKPASLYNIQRMLEEKPDFGQIFKTGYSDLDSLVKFRPTDLMVIAGRPSVGKSSLGLSMLAEMALSFPVGLISFEMALFQIGKRLSEMYSFDKLNAINSNFVACSPSAFTLNEVRKAMREAVDKSGAKVIMVDYLQLMEMRGRSESRRIEITNIIRGLKELAKEFLVGLIVISSLARGEGGEDTRPYMGMLKESGDIEYCADVVLFLYHKKGEQITELIIDKNRFGKAKKIVPLVWLEERVMYGSHSWMEPTDGRMRAAGEREAGENEKDS